MKETVGHSELYPFRARTLGQSVFLSTPWGSNAWLSAEEYSAIMHQRPLPSAAARRLENAGFLRNKTTPSTIREAYASRFHFLRSGPTLHALVLTERCNHGCQYCHSSVVSMNRTDTDMTASTAENAVDFALQTTSPWLTIEFQGGEPTANWTVLQHTVEYARQQNKQQGKELSFSLVTNFSLMDEEKMNWLLDNRIQVCTSLDGPEALHNKIRIFRDGNAYENVVRWIERFNEEYVVRGLDPTLYKVEALPTITRDSLSQPRRIVDAFIEAGCRSIFLRKLDPFGFAEQTRKKLGYSISEFLEFYEEALQYIIARNKEGTEVLERNAAIVLCKILSGVDPNYLDLRTPGGAAIGQLAYHPQGHVYSSDEGRMVGAMGDDTFLLGHLDDLSYQKLMRSPAVKALVLAGMNRNEPGCDRCAYQPYCGLQPEYNYKTQGSLSGRMAESSWCRKHLGIFDIVVRTYFEGDEETQLLMRRWTISRPQEYFLQATSEQRST